MFKLALKKTFFDAWDNFFSVFLLNIGFIIISLSTILLIPIVSKIPYCLLPTIILMTLIFHIYSGAASYICKIITDYEKPTFKKFFSAVKKTFLSSIILGCTTILYFTIAIFLVSIYLQQKLTINLVAIILFVFTNIIIITASQYVFAIQSRLNRKPLKIIKKSFLLLFDNTKFSLALLFINIIILILSFLTLFFVVGFSTNLIWTNTSLKLRLYKYDYLEQFPNANKKQIPWEKLTSDDSKKTASRTLISIIFPWKE